jgi:hypothetical protein
MLTEPKAAAEMITVGYFSLASDALAVPCAVLAILIVRLVTRLQHDAALPIAARFVAAA